MTGRLDGQVAVVTGGASGIGQSTALRFLQEDARVVIGDYDQTTGEATLDRLAGAGFVDASRFELVDVSEEDQVEALMGWAVDELGRLEAMGDAFDQAQPWYRCGRPEDVAALVTFLANPEAEFISGEHVVIDGQPPPARELKPVLEN